MDNYSSEVPIQHEPMGTPTKIVLIVIAVLVFIGGVIKAYSMMFGTAPTKTASEIQLQLHLNEERKQKEEERKETWREQKKSVRKRGLASMEQPPVVLPINDQEMALQVEKVQGQAIDPKIEVENVDMPL